jgi:hypothetical protein
MTTGQAALTSTAALIIAANLTRSSCLITPTADIYIGNATVTASSGLLLKANVTYPIETTAAIYGITASGSATATYLDESGSGWPVQTIN